jgi:hypothetical protein
MKNIILDLFTFIGGLAAIWFFWEKCDENSYCFPLALTLVVLAIVMWGWYRWQKKAIKPQGTDESEGPLAWDSLYYVERSPVESKAYEIVTKPGALIRIKAPRQMGKTSLMMRMLDHAKKQGHPTVYLSLDQVDHAALANLEEFLRWFCTRITKKLNWPADKVTHHWSKLQSGMSNCSDYFENVLLAEMSHPLVLALDKVDWIFEHENIATDFFKLVRSWHEQSKHQEVWQKMVLVLVHTENVPLSFYYSSPFYNVGTSIELPVFNATQVQDLVQRYKLNWKMPEIEPLMAMLGGHPHLVHLALYEIAHKRITLAQVLENAPTEKGIFGSHLQRLLMDLQTDKEVDLVTTMRQVVSTNVPIEIDSRASLKLCSRGLINKAPNNTVEPLCGLYLQYFQNRL